MELLKFFIKDAVPAVGLTSFREKKSPYLYAPEPNYSIRLPVFKPNYNNNFFLK